jgi:LMBR1 domain-containing protein 1
MIVMTIILAIVLIIVNIYLLAYYCHPDDRGFGSAFICKFVVVLGMTLSWAQVLMLPLDVSNSRGSDGGIRMDIFWIVIYLTTAVFLVFIIPSLTYYYEADSEWSCWQKIKYSFCYLFATIIVTIAILIITYVLLSKAEIPITTINCSIANLQRSDSTDEVVFTNCMRNETTMTIDVSFPIFVIGLMSFVSWFLFVIFGGIGLAALPLDFFYDFCTRPKKISPSELKYLKEKTVRRAKEIEKVLQECKTLESQRVMENGCTIFKININFYLIQFSLE